MQIDLRTVSIEPLRNTFDHIIKRFGDKPASRYQEATYDVQAANNLQYRPLWDPEHQLHDPSRTAITMEDWYAFKDPRQYYYGAYTLNRARQQETMESSFDFVESRNLIDWVPEHLRTNALLLLMPLRHAAWGANQNNSHLCAVGYGTAFTQPCIFYAMDSLGIAQYLTRIGLLIGDVDAIERGKNAWLSDERWQPLRRYVEKTMVIDDWFELFVAQNLVLDGLIYPLIYGEIVDKRWSSEGGSALAMMTSFMSEWSKETKRWVDSCAKIAAGENDENKTLINQWLNHWVKEAKHALLPIIEIADEKEAEALLDGVLVDFEARIKKVGLHLENEA